MEEHGRINLSKQLYNYSFIVNDDVKPHPVRHDSSKLDRTIVLH